MAVSVTDGSAALLLDAVHHYAVLWQIERVDGIVLRFTDHDREISFNGQSFVPAGGMSASARQKQDGLRARELEARGLITSDAIRDDDIRAGRYREAKVTEMLVDWRYPWASEPDGIVKSIYWIGEIKWAESHWSAAIAGQSRWLHGNIGEFYGRTCRYTLYDARCKVVEASFQAAGTVTAVTAQRETFDASGISATADFYTDGRLAWTSGLNNGILSEVRVHSGTNIQLHVAVPFDIFVGDAFTVSAGCDKLLATCRDKFNNLPNHGGFPFIPGTDAILNTPNAPA